jgi:alkanesulfonate monooxygenase SsuD/methylene tetrahydromethanopterin reductase-like flavin-dependent oxidoreductase (luciferase family)
LAQSVATLAEAAPGRFNFGIGTTAHVFGESWYGVPLGEPYRQVKETVEFLRSALAGEKFTGRVGERDVTGFRLGVRLPEPPPILIAALRPGMFRLAGSVGDGAIINWLSPSDVSTVAPYVNEDAAPGDEKEIVARIFVAPTEDRETIMSAGKFMFAAYASVPVYAEFHKWLGREDDLADFWKLWGEGDRKGAAASIPDHVIDELIVWGSPEQCRDRINAYVDNGVTTPCLAILPFGLDQQQAYRDLAPR